MERHLLTGLLLLLTFAQGAWAEEEPPAPRSEIVVRAVGKTTSGTVVATPGTDSDPVETRRQDLDAAGSARLALPHGTWSIEIASEGFWSERRDVDVGAQDEALEIRLLPAAEVVGELSLPRGEVAPGELRPEFRFVSSLSSHLGLEQGTSSCSLGEELRFECELPAGTLDLTLRARSFVPRRFWDLQLPRNDSKDLGSVKLVRGSAVSGWVEIQEGHADPRDARLTLETVELPGAGSPAVERDRELTRFEVRANRRGHFAFEGVPPGSYALTVQLDGYAPVERSGIPVVQDAESVIRKPLELFHSRDLRVSVEPPFDSENRNWTVRLRAFETPDAKPLEALTEDGVAVVKSVPAGRYSVLLMDGDRAHRWWREVEIDPAQDELAIQVESYPVRGRVLFGRDGFPADLIFGGTSGVIRVAARSDDDGEFRVELPRAGDWRVDVRGGAVQGTKWVEVPQQDGTAEIDIIFPDNELAGRVIDTSGVPVGGAAVLLFAAGDLRSGQTDDDGSFAFIGVEEGEAVLAASHGPDRGSAELRIEVQATGTTDCGELILRDRLRLAGAVESNSGPVPGALVLALAEEPTGLRFLPEQAFSEREGFFELSVPATATRLRVAVFAPGFPLQVLDVPADPAIPILLPVGGEGGELVLRPGLSDSSIAPGSVAVFHQGFPLDAGTLNMWARQNGSASSATELRVPRLAEGMYTVCTDIAPRDLLSTLQSQSTSFGDCHKVRVRENDVTEVDLEVEQQP